METSVWWKRKFKTRIWFTVVAYGHPKDNKDEIYTVLQVESMERMQEMLNLPSMVKLRTEAGVDLETQTFIMLEGGN